MEASSKARVSWSFGRSPSRSMVPDAVGKALVRAWRRAGLIPPPTVKEIPKAKTALSSARCRWHRYWSHRDLCGFARGTRPSPGEEFATFTDESHALANWLMACSIKTVAIESTGVYWIALFQILERRGLEVCLVNARHVKGVPGRKTDIQDCQWLQYLHSVGLLQDLPVRKRYHDMLLKSASRQVLLMQKVPSPK